MIGSKKKKKVVLKSFDLSTSENKNNPIAKIMELIVRS
jgi:hypothetical protein